MQYIFIVFTTAAPPWNTFRIHAFSLLSIDSIFSKFVLKENVSQLLVLSFGSYILSALSSAMIPEPYV